jgi:ABC-type transport system substrate-binding protein
LNIYYLGFNCSRPPFDNINLRKAFSYAIDREKILKTFYEGRGRLAMGPVPDILRRWQPLFPYSFNPQEAKRLINAGGMKDRTVVFYITADQQEVIDMAEIIQSYLQKVGLKIQIKQLEWSAFKSAVNNGEPDLFWLSWWADYPDPDNFLFPLFHSSNHGAGGNRSRYTNQEVDRLIEAGQEALQIAARDKYYRNAEKIIIEEAPWVFFWHKNDFTVRQAYLKQYKIYPVYSIDKGTEVSF